MSSLTLFRPFRRLRGGAMHVLTLYEAAATHDQIIWECRPRYDGEYSTETLQNGEGCGGCDPDEAGCQTCPVVTGPYTSWRS
jgi:hypothetical protein